MTVASTTIDISQILTPLLQVLGVALSALAIWGAQRVIAWLNLKVSASQAAQFNDAIQKSMTYGLTQAQSLIEAHGWDHPTVKNAAVATALDYATAHFPQALAGAGIDVKNTAATAAFVTGALNRAFPEVAKTVADSPATPPLNAGAAAPTIINPRNPT